VAAGALGMATAGAAFACRLDDFRAGAWALASGRGARLAAGGNGAGLGAPGFLASDLARPEDGFLAFPFSSFLATASPLHQARQFNHLLRAGLHGVTCRGPLDTVPDVVMYSLGPVKSTSSPLTCRGRKLFVE